MEPQTAGQEAGRFEQLGQQALGYVAELPGRFMESARTFRDNAQTYGAVGLTGAVSVAGVAKMEDVLTPDSVASDKSVAGQHSSSDSGKGPNRPNNDAVVAGGGFGAYTFVNKKVHTTCGERATEKYNPKLSLHLEKGKKDTYDFTMRLRSMKNCAKYGKRTVKMYTVVKGAETNPRADGKYREAHGPFALSTNKASRLTRGIKIERRNFCPDPDDKSSAARFRKVAKVTWNPNGSKRPSETVTRYSNPFTNCKATEKYPLSNHHK